MPVPAIDVGDVRSRFLADLDAGRVPVIAGCAEQGRWWVRSIRLEDGLVLIVDDGERSLIRLPFTQASDGLAYGKPSLISNLPIAASAARDNVQVLASWSTSTTPITSHPKEPTTMKVNQAQLARRLGLPANSHESTIRGCLAGREIEREVRATIAASAPRTRVDAATVRAASNDELRRLADTVLTSAARDVLADEIGHRDLMARSYPGMGRTMRSPRARIQYYS